MGAGVRIGCFIAAAVCLITSASGAGTRESKLVRSLTGRSETVRLRAINSVQVPAVGKSVLNELILAAKDNVAKTEPDDLVRYSTVSLLYTIGRIDDIRS